MDIKDLSAVDYKWIDLHNSCFPGNKIDAADYVWMVDNYSDADWDDFVNGVPGF